MHSPVTAGSHAGTSSKIEQAAKHGRSSLAAQQMGKWFCCHVVVCLHGASDCLILLKRETSLRGCAEEAGGVTCCCLCCCLCCCHRCCQALGVALKLTFQGDNQLMYIHFYLFLLVRMLASLYTAHTDSAHSVVHERQGVISSRTVTTQHGGLADCDKQLTAHRCLCFVPALA